MGLETLLRQKTHNSARSNKSATGLNCFAPRSFDALAAAAAAAAARSGPQRPDCRGRNSGSAFWDRHRLKKGSPGGQRTHTTAPCHYHRSLPCCSSFHVRPLVRPPAFYACQRGYISAVASGSPFSLFVYLLIAFKIMQMAVSKVGCRFFPADVRYCPKLEWYRSPEVFKFVYRNAIGSSASERAFHLIAFYGMRKQKAWLRANVINFHQI